MSKKIYKSTLKSGSLMAGYFRYSDVFQILESDKVSSIQNGKYLDIEYNEAYSIPISDWNENGGKDSPIYAERAHLNLLKELMSLLSIVTNQHYEIDYNGETNIRLSPQKEIEEFSKVSSPHEIRKDPYRISQRRNTTRSFVSIHPEADCFFENYFNLDSAARSRYNASIFLYQSMRKIFLTSASMAVAGCISAIENLMDFEHKKTEATLKKCKECKQPVYKISARFKEFMLKYSEFDVENRNKLLNKFYAKRSDISHAGAILDIDRFLSDFSMKEHEEFTEIETHVRIALYNYMLKYDFDSLQ